MTGATAIKILYLGASIVRAYKRMGVGSGYTNHLGPLHVNAAGKYGRDFIPGHPMVCENNVRMDLCE